jgi:hypothetical protein
MRQDDDAILLQGFVSPACPEPAMRYVKATDGWKAIRVCQCGSFTYYPMPGGKKECTGCGRNI